MIQALLLGLALMSLQREAITESVEPIEEIVIVEENIYPMNYMGDCYEEIEEEFSQEEIDLMVRVVMSEAGGQPMECKEAVATTMLARYYSPNYVDDIIQIIKDGYSTHDNGTPNEECHQAVANAIEHWGTPDQVLPWCCYYFRGGHYHEWAQDYRKIGALYFSIPADACVD